MNQVLLIEDSPEFQLLVKELIPATLAQVTCVATASEAKMELKNGEFELILLDLSLPDYDGLTFLAELREETSHRKTPVIPLTGNSETLSKVKAFSLGAEDYITKPFDPLEFLARIEAKLKNLRMRKAEPDSIVRGDLKVDPTFQKASVLRHGGEDDLALTPAEFKILYFLVRNEGQSFTGKQILTSLWGKNVHVVDHSIYTHVYGIRKKLGTRAHYVQSLERGGYHFTLKPQS